MLVNNRLQRISAVEKLWPVLTVTKLLQPDHRKNAVTGVFQSSHTNERYFNELYLPAINTFARLVQQLPASEVDHHAAPGGLLDHALESTLNALRIRRAHMLPANTPPEEVSRLESLWTYATFGAALLHDIGKTAVDQRITLYDRKKRALPEPWSPFEDFIDARANWYAVEFRRDRQYALHQRTSALLVPRILPAKGLAWLTTNTEVFAAFSAAITGHLEDAGVLGQIVTEADRRSVARNKGAVKGGYMAASTKPLHEKLLSALRVLIDRGDLALNRPGAAGWLTEKGLWMMGTRTVSALRQHLTEEGHSGIPASNSRLFDELMQHRVVIANGDKAIWRIQVNQGEWKPEPFTGLRLPPEKVWSLAKQRPSLFNGSVTIVSELQPKEGAGEDAAIQANIRSQLEQSEDPSSSASSSPPVATTPFADTPSVRDTAQPAPSPWFNGSTHDDVEAPAGGETGSGVITRCTATDSPTGCETREEEQGETPNLGKRFYDWLRVGLQNKSIRYNDAEAAVHVVEAGVLLVSPAIFRRFVREHEDTCSSWENVQKHVQRLRRNQKTPALTNIHVYQVQGENRAPTKLKGFLIPDKAMLFGEKIPDTNPYLTPIAESD